MVPPLPPCPGAWCLPCPPVLVHGASPAFLSWCMVPPLPPCADPQIPSLRCAGRITSVTCCPHTTVWSQGVTPAWAPTSPCVTLTLVRRYCWSAWRKSRWGAMCGTCTCTCAYAHADAPAHTYTHMHMHMHPHPYVHTHSPTCMRTRTYTCAQAPAHGAPSCKLSGEFLLPFPRYSLPYPCYCLSGCRSSVRSS